MTGSLIDKIIECYNLSTEEDDEFRLASMETNKETTIYLNSISNEQVELTYRFSRRNEGMDKNTLSKIRELLEDN